MPPGGTLRPTPPSVLAQIWCRGRVRASGRARRLVTVMTETRLFTLDGARKNDPAVRRWFTASPDRLRLIAREWFEQMRSCGPDVLELLHDGHPTACIGNLAFGYVNAFRAHVNVGFFFGSVLEDPAGLLEGTGRFMRHVRVDPDFPPPEQALRDLIATAYADVKSR
jgi:hypothetical protein